MHRRLVAISAVGALAAAFAPAVLTGGSVVDALQRALVVGLVTYVGAHARRWSWLLAGALVAVPARGTSLAIVLLALVVITAASALRRRPKDLGAIGLAGVANAPFWYGPEVWSFAPLLAVAAFVVLVASGQRLLRRNRQRVTRWVLVGALAIALVAVVGLGVTILQASGHVSRGSTAARRALSAARDGEAEEAGAQLGVARREFAAARRAFHGIPARPAALVPGLAQQARAVRVAVEAGEDVSQAGDDLVATADYDELQYAGRIDLDQVGRLAGPTARADGVLRRATERLSDVADGWLLPPVQDRVDRFRDELSDAQDDTALAADLLEVTPGLFGADGQQRYLVAFLTPAELRGAGGFIGSYAELTASGGEVDLTRSGGIRDLIDGAPPNTRTLTGPKDYLARYGRFEPQDYLQDITYSPDFPSDASVLAQLYPQSGGAPLDGVIGVDPTGLAALLELTGPVAVDGLAQPLSSANAIEVLTRSQYIDIPDDTVQERILADAVRLTFEKLTSGRLPGPRALGEALSPAARGGHLRLWSPEADEQAVFERVGADGALRIPSGADGFSVVQQNTGNNKLDGYLHRTITYDASVDARTGALSSTMTIELRNEVPSLDLPDAVVGNSRGAPIGTNVAWLTVFTPDVVVAATVDGTPKVLAPSREAGLNAWDLPLVSIPPGGTVTITLSLTGSVDLTDGYDLRILPQPVANPDVFAATLRVEHGRAGGRSGAYRLVSRGPVVAPTTHRVRVDR